MAGEVAGCDDLPGVIDAVPVVLSEIMNDEAINSWGDIALRHTVFG